jgi:hypothetical protein
LAYRLHFVEPEAWLLTLGGENFGPGEAFSTPVQNAWDDFMERALCWATTL